MNNAVVSRWLRFAAVVGAGYSVLCGAVYFTQDQLLFFPRANHPTAVSQLDDRSWSVNVGNVTLRGWVVPTTTPNTAPLVLFFGGNSQDVAVAAANQPPIANYVYVNYRGYGGSTGEASADLLKSDALLIYDAAIAELPHNGNVLVHGRSLGSGVAVHLASQRPVVGAILVTPFDSLTAVAQRHYAWLPVNWLLKHRMDSITAAPSLTIPALVLTAGHDTVIPEAHSIRLAQAWGGAAEVVRFPVATHGTIGNSEQFQRRVAQFVARY